MSSFIEFLGANIIGFSQNGFVMFPSKQCIEMGIIRKPSVTLMEYSVVTSQGKDSG